MRNVLLPLAACLALCGGAAAVTATTAGAQPTRAPQMTTDQMTPGMRDNGRALRFEHRAEMCKTLYARKAGKLAFLEAKLSLSPAQAPLFARWKAVSLDAARRHAAACADRPARGERPSITERLARQENRLKQRLADLQAERPALIALADSLTPEQRQAFRHDAGRHGHHGMMRGFGRHQAQPL